VRAWRPHADMQYVAVQSMNVLFRQDPTTRFKAVGAQGRRFFTTDGAQPISNGGLVYNGFSQYVPLVLYLLRLSGGRFVSPRRDCPLSSSTRHTRPSFRPDRSWYVTHLGIR
jgi:hypothetical protein